MTGPCVDEISLESLVAFQCGLEQIVEPQKLG